jgi:hypothetical protein
MSQRRAQAALLIVVVASCGKRISVPPSPEEASPICVSPTEFGAVVDDGKDDRAAVQQAFEVAASRRLDVCLPAGDLHVGRVPGRISSLITPMQGIRIRGMGTRSRFVMLGKPDDEHSRDWWVIQVTGTGHRLQDFAMDGSARDVTDEQTHLIQVRGPARDIQLERLRLAIPVQSISKGGDCIRLLGDPGEEVQNVRIANVVGEVCARSFIAFQRLVSNVTVDHVTSREVGGQAIDMEPSGDAIRDVTIRNSMFRRGSIARGQTTVALAGSRIHSENLVLEHSVVEGGIQVFRVRNALIRHNYIHGSLRGLGLIKVQAASERVQIEHNVIQRTGESGGGVELFSHNGGWPRDVGIRGNVIIMAGSGFPIHGEPVQALDVSNNSIVCQAPGFAAVFLRGVVVSIDRARVHRNTISGRCVAAVRIAQHHTNTTGAIVVEANVIDGVQAGVIFENGEPSVKPRIDGNRFKGLRSTDHVRGAPLGYEGTNM